MGNWRLDIRNRRFSGAADASSATASRGSYFLFSIISSSEVES